MVSATLSDRAGNHIVKRVGFSFGYLILGPIYLLFRLRWEGLLLIICYYYLLPIPGMEYICSSIGNLSFNEGVKKGITDTLLFFRGGFTDPRTYVGILIVLAFHILFSFFCDNWLLGKKIRKKGLSPLSEDDARKLIYAHAVKPDVLLAKEVSEKEHLFEQAERVWEDKNLSYTTMLSRSEMERIQDEEMKGNVKSGNDDLAHKRHLDNANLLAKGVITKEEYDILEKRNGSSK